MGVAESTFPHPKQWRIPGIDKDLDAIRITVRDLTREWLGNGRDGRPSLRLALANGKSV